jgi:very-short-patch-repair endonuclease
MRADLLAAAHGYGGVITRSQALRAVPVHVLDKAVQAGALVRVFARVYALPEFAADVDVRRRAALLSVPGAALSHTDALAVWRALPRGLVPTGPVHLTVADDGRQRGRQAGLVVHRRAGFRRDDCFEIGKPALLTVALPHALVDIWALLASDHARAAVIDSVRTGRLSVARIAEEVRRRPRTARVAELRRLLQLLADGCQSELEIWGVERVFDHPSLPRARAQHRVDLGGRFVFLDRAYVEESVAVELDGAEHHFSAAQRERDMRRDERLAVLGWVVVRLSWRRVRSDPDGVRRALCELLATRREQLRGGDAVTSPPGIVAIGP